MDFRKADLRRPVIASEGVDSAEEGVGLVGLGGQADGALAGLQGRVQIALFNVQAGEFQMQEAGMRLGCAGPGASRQQRGSGNFAPGCC